MNTQRRPTTPAVKILAAILFAGLAYWMWSIAAASNDAEKRLRHVRIENACQSAWSYLDCMARYHEKP